MRFLIFSLAALFLFSCSSKFNLQKRRYNKGYYFGINSGKNSASSTLAHNEPKKEKSAASDVAEAKKNIYSEPALVDRENPDLQVTAKYTGKHQVTQATREKRGSTVLIKNLPYKDIALAYTKNLSYKASKLTKPYDYFGGSGLGLFGLIGIISGIISFIVLLVYLFLILSSLGLLASSTDILLIFVVILIVGIIVGVVILANSD